MMENFVRTGTSSSFVGGMYGNGNGFFDSPSFPSPASSRQDSQHQPLPGTRDGGGAQPFESKSFFSSSSSTYKDGRWVTESYEESNVNGRRKARREWTDSEVSASIRYLPLYFLI